MITRNFKNLQKMMLMSFGSSKSGVDMVPLRLYNGNTVYHRGCFSSGFPYSASGTVVYSDNSGIAIGSGTTAPTEDDYCLEQRITSGVSATASTRTTRMVGDVLSIEFQFALQNTSAESVTVSEIAYLAIVFHSAYNTTGTIMLDRTLLETPVTIPPGESASFTYTLSVE